MRYKPMRVCYPCPARNTPRWHTVLPSVASPEDPPALPTAGSPTPTCPGSREEPEAVAWLGNAWDAAG